jgi:hypothetical protein
LRRDRERTDQKRAGKEEQELRWRSSEKAYP